MSASRHPEEITQSLPIPEHKMGWIVGKKGSYITQLCRKSGAHITISESTSREYGMVWKYVCSCVSILLLLLFHLFLFILVFQVQITGNGRAVDRAKKLLHIRLDRLESTTKGNENGNHHNGGGGGGPDEVSPADDGADGDEDDTA
jgi:predicted PilT family ATPase